MRPAPAPAAPVIYTLGHSRHSPERFLELLAQHAIDLVIDVRSRPHSRFCPHFNRQALEKLLQSAGRRYLFLGRELGGKPQELEGEVSAEVVWDYLRRRPQFREGLGRVLVEARNSRVCLLCAEADPAACHRGQLLAPELEALGAEVMHILADGSLRPHRQLVLPPPRPRQGRLF